jgi:AcrR family transcriptional regulator
MIESPHTPPRAERTQRRGDRRRQALLRAAGILIGRHALPEVRYAAVCALAGVPPSSAYHFYPDLDAIYRVLLEVDRVALDAALLRPLRRKQLRSWQTVVECLVARAAQHHRRHPAAAKLAIGGQTPPHLKRVGREADRVRAGLALRMLEHLFVLPPIRRRQRVAFLAAEIVDAVFTASMIESGRLTPAYVALAKSAAIGFLSQHLGSRALPRAARHVGRARQ